MTTDCVGCRKSNGWWSRALTALRGFLIAGTAMALPSHAQAADTPLLLSDLTAAPAQFLNKTVDLLIVEPLGGPTTAAMLASTVYGQVPIRIPDAPGFELSLVPAGFKLDDPNRYQQKFTQVLRAPIRVQGEFLSDDDLSKWTKRPAYVIRVAQIQPLAPPMPQPVHALADIKADPQRWDRKRVSYQGVLRSGFEISSLDAEIWLSSEPQTVVRGARRSAAPRGIQESPVRVVGTLYTRPSARFGHLGGYTFELVASELEFLPSSPGSH